MNFSWEVFLRSLTSSELFYGALLALVVTFFSALFGIAIGVALALARMSKRPWLSRLAVGYIFVGRGVPQLLWLLFVWNAVPQIIPIFKENWFTPFLAAIVALALSEAAYFAEITRGGLLGVPPGQVDAARMLGMRPGQVFWRVKWPQAVRIFLPTAGNELISLMKLTSLASVISLKELLRAAEIKVSSTYRFLENYAAAAVWYLVLVSLLMVAQALIERRMRWTSTGLKKIRVNQDGADLTGVTQ